MSKCKLSVARIGKDARGRVSNLRGVGEGQRAPLLFKARRDSPSPLAA